MAGFIHSAKVPKLYKAAAKVAKKSEENGASLKSLVFEIHHPNVQSVQALVFETLKRQPQIDFLIKKSRLFEKEPRLDPWLARVLIYEMILNKKQLYSESKPIKTILAYEQILKAHLTDAEAPVETVKVKKPRFVRVNVLKSSLNDAVDHFQDEDWMFTQFADSKDYTGFLERVAGISDDEFMVDIHIDNLLIFPPSTQFYNHSGYLNGQMMLQDKASCFSAQLLNPPKGSIILDMCAAPGMKTTHLAALINNEGKIFAIEMNKNRCETLHQMVENAGASCVQVLNKDAITVFDKDIPDVEYILVDPSCSGSGIVDRLEVKSNSSPSQERLKSLAGFQIKLLKHALRSFPKAKRVVYSTCSIYSEENEDVVSEVIASCIGFKLVSIKDRLKAPWFNFASNKEGSVGSHCLYAKPEVDLTNGFFVAVFERLEEGEKNVFLKAGLARNFNKEGKFKRKQDDETLEPTEVKKKKKSIQNRIEMEDEHSHNEFENNNAEALKTKKKKKNIKNRIEIEDEHSHNECENNNAVALKTKKKKKNIENRNGMEDEHSHNEVENNNAEALKKKKKKKNIENKSGMEDEHSHNECENNNAEALKTKKKKKNIKNRNEIEDEHSHNECENNNAVALKTKKKKKNIENRNEMEDEHSHNEVENNNAEALKKKKKKKNIENRSGMEDEHSHNEFENNNAQALKTKKKKKNIMNGNGMEDEHSLNKCENNVKALKTKKKKKHELIIETIKSTKTSNEYENCADKKKKKKRETITEKATEDCVHKKKNKKKKKKENDCAE